MLPPGETTYFYIQGEEIDNYLYAENQQKKETKGD